MTTPLGQRTARHRAFVQNPPEGQRYTYAYNRLGASPFAAFAFRRHRRVEHRRYTVLSAAFRRAGSPLRITKEHARPHIPLRSCIDGHVYKIYSRNLDVGVFHAEVEGFTGIRNKFGWNYLFTEFHYDQGPPYGTVSPLEDLGPLPAGIIDNLQWENQPLFEYLDNTFYGGRLGRDNAEQALAAARERAAEEAEEAAKSVEEKTPL